MRMRDKYWVQCGKASRQKRLHRAVSIFVCFMALAMVFTLTMPVITAEETEAGESESVQNVLRSDGKSGPISAVEVEKEEGFPSTASLIVQVMPDQEAGVLNQYINASLQDKTQTANAKIGIQLNIIDSENESYLKENPFNGKIRFYMNELPDQETVKLFRLRIMNYPNNISVEPVKYNVEPAKEDSLGYVEFKSGLTWYQVDDYYGSPADYFVFATVTQKSPLSPIHMQITKVGDYTLEKPAATYPAGGNQYVELTATAKAPSEHFHMFIGGLLNQQVTVTNHKGEAVEIKQLTRQADRNKPGPIYEISGTEAGTELTFTIRGITQSENSSSFQEAGMFFVDEAEVETFGANYNPYGVPSVKGGAVCFLGKPTLALELFDQYNQQIDPARVDSASGSSGLNLLSFYLTGSTRVWEAYEGSTFYYTTNEEKQKVNRLASCIQGFELKDESGTVVSKIPFEERPSATPPYSHIPLAFSFDRPGKYTLDVIPKNGTEYEYDPVTIEVTLDAPETAPGAAVMIQSTQNQVMVMDYGNDSGYRYTINGKPVPLMAGQELNAMYESLLQSYASSTSSLAYSPALPKEFGSTGAAIAKVNVNIPDLPAVSGGVEMRIVEGDSKSEAITASYNDDIQWESLVDVSGTTPFDWIVELRYDVNNQGYVTGNGVNPLFTKISEPSVTLILENKQEIRLNPKMYTLKSPDGYFKVDQTSFGTIEPSQYNGKWAERWYEISPKSGQKPYFLHPYFEKQVLHIGSDAASALGDNKLPVKYIKVTNQGNLSPWAYAGGYGNPARVLAFGKLPEPEPIVKVKKASAEASAEGTLTENENADIVPDYYLSNSGYTNIGFDTTCVYTSSVTVHKVDENNKDLNGAEFTITKAETAGETDARVIQGKSSHLVLSHFIPGFGAIRPVPDSVDDVSRRNLTSIGEPALEAADPEGDETSSKAYLTYAGLKEGNYVIRETKAPANYKIADPINLELSAALPSQIDTGYEFCRWTAKVNGQEIPVVKQLSDEYPEESDKSYQMFSCNSSCIILRVADEPEEPGIVLPLTGGMGTNELAVLGLLLVIFAGAVLAKRRRQRGQGPVQ